MRVLVVGAGGFVGSQIAAAPGRDGHDVVHGVRGRQDRGRFSAEIASDFAPFFVVPLLVVYKPVI